jgi:hypothetical protein
VSELRETIGSDAETCRYCNAAVDRGAATAAIKLQQQINQACNEASVVRNMAGFMWIMIVIQFFYVMMARILFFG